MQYKRVYDARETLDLERFGSPERNNINTYVLLVASFIASKSKDMSELRPHVCGLSWVSP
jgi:hypothetical protein